MRRLSVISVLLMVCFQAFSQSAAEQIKDILSNYRVSIKYTYSDSAGNEIGNGLATIQGHCYKVIENSTVFCCDGTTLWTKIPGSKEIYIENGGGPNDLFGNLDSIIDKVSDLTLDGNRVSFKLTMQGIPDTLDCRATILGKTNYSEDLKDFRLEAVDYDRLWTITDLR